MKNASPRYTEFYKKMIDANEKRFKSELCKDCKPYYKEFIKTAKHLHGGKP
jgi:predicted nucleic-acid-binding Zn-ribbon protein